MPGILNYKNYLKTLQAITDIGHTFPSTQQKFTFTVEGGVTGLWTASLEAVTLIVDKVSYDRRTNSPKFDDSQVIGYFEGAITTSTQTTTGTIYLPANVYTGPILPGGEQYVPITVYNLTWSDGTETYSHQLGYIQNWEPGVKVGNPYDEYDFEPVDPVSSILLLDDTVGLNKIIYGDTLVLRARTDIPIDLGTENVVKLYKIVGGQDVYVTETYFVGKTALFNIPTNPNFPIGNYEFVAVHGGRRQYGRTRSNHLQIEVLEGIPLLVNTSTFVPSKVYYFPGDTVTHTLGVYPDPAFTATGYAVSNTTTVRLINGWPPNTQWLVEQDQFVNGLNTATFVTSATMVDTGLVYVNSLTNYSVITGTVTTSVYTATILVWNTETVRTAWESWPLARYASGSYNAYINVANTTTVTVTATSFPITISQFPSTRVYNQTFQVTVNTTSTPYYQPITIYATSGTTTIALLTTSSSGNSQFTATISNLTNTGTWTLFASFPGDSGSSIFLANLPSTSNTLTHVVLPGYDLGAQLTFSRTTNTDVLYVLATTSTTLTNTVTFYDGVVELGQAQWTRNVEDVEVVLSPGANYQPGSFANSFDGLKETPYRFRDQALENFIDLSRVGSSGNPRQDIVNAWMTTPQPNTALGYYSATGQLPISPTNATLGKRVNKYRLFKYYDGSNYNVNDAYSLADSISRDPTWKREIVSGVVINGVTNITSQNQFKEDTIGTSQGYNVIGILAEQGKTRPIVTTSTSQRLYFKAPPDTGVARGAASRGTSDKLRYIDLVEFIGTTSWVSQDLDLNTTTNQVWLYKFTPTIPQTNVIFRTSDPLEAAVERAVVNNSLSTLNKSQVNQDIYDYGVKKWISQNTADPVQNDLAEFYNDWFWTFTNPDTQPFFYTETTYQGLTTGTGNLQVAYIELPLNTINNRLTVHATWPGTLDLGEEYGKFLPFDIYLQPIPLLLSLKAFNIDVQGQRLKDTVKIYNTNKVALDVSLTPNPNVYGNYNNFINGTVTLRDNDTNQLIAQTTVTNSTATVFVYAETLNSTPNSTKTVNIKASFSSTNTNISSSTSVITNIQAVNNSYYNYHSFTNNNIELVALGSRPFSNGTGNPAIFIGGTIGINCPFFANLSSTANSVIFFSFYYKIQRTGDPLPVDLNPLTITNPGIAANIHPNFDFPYYKLGPNIFAIERITNNQFSRDVNFAPQYFQASVRSQFVADGSPYYSGQYHIYAYVWGRDLRNPAEPLASIPLDAKIGFRNTTNPFIL